MENKDDNPSARKSFKRKQCAAGIGNPLDQISLHCRKTRSFEAILSVRKSSGYSSRTGNVMDALRSLPASVGLSKNGDPIQYEVSQIPDQPNSKI